MIKMISTTQELAAYCADAAKFPYITVDTEFLRQSTYYSKLCLIQLAMPSPQEGAAVLVDPLAKGLSLAPLYELFTNPAVVKVLHAARQDIEIFWHDAGIIPAPLFDTQAAAMVCGYGEQAAYATLVQKIAKVDIDKSSRFTDWSHRPLTEEQQKYALGDVTHLRQVYEHLDQKLEQTGRRSWVEEELKSLCDPASYVVDPEHAWQRVRIRTNSRRFAAYLKELAKYRETTAQSNNIPRSRILKDEAMNEIAATRPKTMKALHKLRLLHSYARKKEVSEAILGIITRVDSMEPDTYPVLKSPQKQPSKNRALADLLRVLLKAKADEYDVAQIMIASAADLDALSVGAQDVAALKGWRFDVFGADALRLCNGKVALAVQNRKICMVDLA